MSAPKESSKITDILLQEYFQVWEKGNRQDIPMFCSAWETWTVAAADGVRCALVRW